ncbi:MAG: RNA polymerase sigma factor [Bdellovibrionaceae bacterium]|nr:RNA polymerase sigma factor [Pseudobdellovibrionaceae bacterium]
MNHSEPNWNKVIEELGPGLYRYFSGNFAAQVASDLVQETFIRLIHKFRCGTFDPAQGNLKNYAYGIARFVRLESRKIRPGFDLMEDDSFADKVPAVSKADESDPVAHLRWAILQLKPTEQEIILLMIDGELSLENISANLDLPLGTVKSHIHRAKENLRRIMEVPV